MFRDMYDFYLILLKVFKYCIAACMHHKPIGNATILMLAKGNKLIELVCFVFRTIDVI
jgi:hypothetical protein